MRILVPVDGSTFSEQAIGYATALTHGNGACIHLARVHEIMPDALATPIASGFAAQLDEEVRTAEVEYLRRLAVRCAICKDVFSLLGPAPDALASMARDQRMDLIVMTTHGRGGLSRAWMGSVADRLVRVSETPVVLLRPSAQSHHGEARAPRNILIPLDGSHSSEAIVAAAVTVGSCAPHGARYTLMNVVPQPIAASREVTRESTSHVLDIRESSSRYLDTIAEPLRARGMQVTTRVMVQDNVAAAIVEESLNDDYDMIAMATHGRSGWSRLTLGSVTDKVMRSSTKPLLVVRSKQPAASLKTA